MKNFISTKTGEKVTYGDVFEIEGKVETPFGEVLVRQHVTLTPEKTPLLIEHGIIKEEEGPRVNMDIEFYIHKLESKLKWNHFKTLECLKALDSVYPVIVVSLLLREIAVELDKLYPDHIDRSEEIYIVSTLDGRISKINKAHIKSFKNFAAFRSLEDARIACRIIKPFLKNLFLTEGEKCK